MKKKGLRSYLVTIGGAAVVFLLVAAFLGGLRSTTEIVVAAQNLPAGARLDADYLALREVHTSDVLPGALASLEDAEGQVLTIARAPGDQLTADMVGEAATTGLANQLMDGHRAVAIHVNQASGLVGILRPGDRVSVVAIVDPQSAQIQQQAVSYAPPPSSLSVDDEKEEEEEQDAGPRELPGPAAYAVVSGLRVLLVPQTFRYEESLPDEESGGFSPVRTSVSAQQSSVILLDVPVEPVEVAGTRGVAMSPAVLLPLLDARAELHLVLEPVEDDGAEISVGANLGTLYRAIIGWAEPVTRTATVGLAEVAPGAVITATGVITPAEGE